MSFARSHFRRLPAFRRHAGSALSVKQIASLYNFPAGLDGNGSTVAIVELGGGYLQSDLVAAGIDPANVSAVSIDGAGNSPGSDADGEVALDIQIVALVAPRAKILVLFAPNTDQGFADAVAYAAAHADIVSISWGAPEDQWSAQALAQMEAQLAKAASAGVNVFVAAGDNGSSDGESGLHADYPASSPSVIGCGGTNLTATSETVWNDGTQGGATGGGFSANFARPAWQKISAAGTMRGVPDVAGDADPQTGYQIVLNGQIDVFGGTSAVAPLWAGLAALLRQALARPLGWLPPVLYALPAGVLRDVTSGNNGAYSAGPGWDPCTGLGSPDGAKLLSALKGPVTPPPAPPPPPPPPPLPSPPPTNSPLFKVVLSRAIPAGGMLMVRLPRKVAMSAGTYDVTPETPGTHASVPLALGGGSPPVDTNAA